jgi:hypothetical protein
MKRALSLILMASLLALAYWLTLQFVMWGMSL